MNEWMNKLINRWMSEITNKQTNSTWINDRNDNLLLGDK